MSNDILENFLRENENDRLLAGDVTAFRHTSPEGGLDTVGFGHKLTEEENESGRVYGISIDNLRSLPKAAVQSAANHILKLDVIKHTKRLDKELRVKYGVRLDSLSARKQAMLVDYQFNLGSAVGKFPKFTRAVITDNDAEQASQMTRYFTDDNDKTWPLARNAKFYSTFMSNEAKQVWSEQ